VEGLGWAQEYASLNRDLMLQLVHQALAKSLAREVKLVGEVTNCHHNYARVEEHFGENVWVTRKGAVSARAGELGIIPGSMGAKSFIVRGKGNEAAYCSCSHGAGRTMSRSQGSPPVFARRPRGADRGRRVPQGRRRDRRDSVGVQGHRRRDGGAVGFSWKSLQPSSRSSA